MRFHIDRYNFPITIIAFIKTHLHFLLNERRAVMPRSLIFNGVGASMKDDCTTLNAKRLYLSLLESVQNQSNALKTLKEYHECFLRYAFDRNGNCCTPNGVSYVDLTNLCLNMIVIEKLRFIRTRTYVFRNISSELSNVRNDIINEIRNGCKSPGRDVRDLVDFATDEVFKRLKRKGCFNWKDENALSNYVFIVLTKLAKSGKFYDYVSGPTGKDKSPDVEDRVDDKSDEDFSPFAFCNKILERPDKLDGEALSAEPSNNRASMSLALDEKIPFDVCKAPFDVCKVLCGARQTPVSFSDGTE